MPPIALQLENKMPQIKKKNSNSTYTFAPNFSPSWQKECPRLKKKTIIILKQLSPIFFKWDWERNFMDPWQAVTFYHNSTTLFIFSTFFVGGCVLNEKKKLWQLRNFIDCWIKYHWIEYNLKKPKNLESLLVQGGFSLQERIWLNIKQTKKYWKLSF